MTAPPGRQAENAVFVRNIGIVIRLECAAILTAAGTLVVALARMSKTEPHGLPTIGQVWSALSLTLAPPLLVLALAAGFLWSKVLLRVALWINLGVLAICAPDEFAASASRALVFCLFCSANIVALRFAYEERLECALQALRSGYVHRWGDRYGHFLATTTCSLLGIALAMVWLQHHLLFQPEHMSKATLWAWNRLGPMLGMVVGILAMRPLTRARRNPLRLLLLSEMLAVVAILVSNRTIDAFAMSALALSCAGLAFLQSDGLHAFLVRLNQRNQ